MFHTMLGCSRIGKTRREHRCFSTAVHLPGGGLGKERNQVTTLLKRKVFPGHQKFQNYSKFSPVCFSTAKDQNLPRQMPTKLLLVLFCRLLRNRAVFAYLPPLGYFTTLCNIHCSFLLHIWFRF